MNRIMNNKLHIFNYFFLLMFAVLVTAALASCGKANNNLPTRDLPQINLIYVSPDGNPVSIYAGAIKLNNANYSYPNSSGYFKLSNIGPQVFTIRSAGAAANILDTVNATVNPNTKYTLIETGIKADSLSKSKSQSTQLLSHIFLVDSSTTPFVGHGKVRFINASPHSGSFNVTANGTAAFNNIAFGKYSPYVEMPAGSYNFQFYQTTNNSTVVYSLPSIAVNDGGLYSIYSYGILGHTDTASFAAAVITNR